MRTTTTFNKLVEAWERHPRYIDSEGGTRSGKTYSMLQLLYLVADADKTPTITSVVSETMPHLKRGAIRDFKLILQADGLWDAERWSETDKIYTLPSGSVIEFFSCDAPGKVHGPARHRLFVNEAQNISYEVARQLFIRTSEIVCLDYNPTHAFWVHDRIKGDEDCVSIHSTYKDNEYLSAEQIAEIERNRNDKNWWRVYGEGKVGQMEGVIYDFEQIDALPDKSDGMVESYGLDFGFTNDPTACVHALIDTRKREIYLDQLIYRKGLLNAHIAQLLEQGGVPLRGVSIYADAAEPKSIAELSQYGYNIKPCYKATKITEQIAYINQYKLYVTKRSVEMLKELRGYVWAKDKDERMLNEPSKVNDHAMDAMRYACFSPFSDFRKQGYNIR